MLTDRYTEVAVSCEAWLALAPIAPWYVDACGVWVTGIETSHTFINIYNRRYKDRWVLNMRRCTPII